jgi:CTP:molybdopterin cytidylyltransferase MocA
LISTRLIDALLGYDGKGGLRAFLRNHDHQAVSIPVEDPFIRLDADTPQDLSRLRETMLAGS